MVSQFMLHDKLCLVVYRCYDVSDNLYFGVNDTTHCPAVDCFPVTARRDVCFISETRRTHELDV